ncbi:hypothetical protein ABZ865_07810 [Streptomyces sp. NPDC047085]|uniref:hypothetical protein n=1 Tax=Streptomyces sp. NPDC047085 TaxID=3155140 RepID=UPI0034024826
MHVPSETSPGREGLPLIDAAAARALFRTAESSGLGRLGTDERFDEWLDSSCDIAFYRNGDHPTQARAVDIRDEVPEWLSNSRIGKARLEAVYLNPGRPEPSPSQETAPDSTGLEDAADATQADETDTDACCCMPGLCWCCEADKERYAKVDNPEEAEGGGGNCLLELVDAFPGGMAQDPSYDLRGEHPPDFDRRSLLGLALLTEVAQRKLDTERWDTAGPWRLWWSSCVCDVTASLNETRDADPSGDDADGDSGEVSYYVSVEYGGDTHTVQVVGTRWGDQHVMYRGPLSEPSGMFEDTGTLEGLRSVLERATEQVREIGYEVDGEWNVNWSRCYVLLDLEHY